MLTRNPGENLQYETYNGMPFNVGKKWETAVPDIGIFCCEYTTPPQCASLPLRIGLATRLLMPGQGRWRCIPDGQVITEDRPLMGKAGITDYEMQNVTPAKDIEVDVDGTIVERRVILTAIAAAKHAERQSSLSSIGQWKASEFSRRLKARHKKSKELIAEADGGEAGMPKLVLVAGKLATWAGSGQAFRQQVAQTNVQNDAQINEAVRAGLRKLRGEQSPAQDDEGAPPAANLSQSKWSGVRVNFGSDANKTVSLSNLVGAVMKSGNSNTRKLRRGGRRASISVFVTDGMSPESSRAEEESDA